MLFFIRLYRLVPMLAVLVVTAIIIYFVVSMRSTKPNAKAAVLKFFTWAFIITSVVFAIGTVYAWAEGNTQVTELIGSFCVACLIFLGITRICYRVFISHYPNYASKPVRSRVITWAERTAKRVRRWWRRQRGIIDDEMLPEVDVEGKDTGEPRRK